jgi:hypothetical protein
MNTATTTLGSIRFMTEAAYIECYLTHCDLTEPPYTLVEQHVKGNHNFVMTHFDNVNEAADAYEAAAERVKSSIAKALAAL